MGQRRLDHLSAEECFDLIAGEEVGRLVYVDESGPTAVPVNFAVDGRTILFRIEHGPREAVLPGPFAFEVDHLDRADHSGWSVLVRGRVAELPIEQVAGVLRRVHGGFPRPWAEGVHNAWMILDPEEVTGRRLGAAL